MKIKVLLFGNLGEKAGTHQLELEEVSTLDACRTLLEERFPWLQEGVYLTAVNEDLLRGDVPLSDGDEVAIMPPFAGG